MKIIDMLNKIANGEEVPEKIRINGYIYEYRGDDYSFIDKNNDNHEYWLFSDGYTDKFQWLENYLRVEIEIIEEEKKIEKIYKDDDDFKNVKRLYRPTKNIEVLANKINEIIDYLQSKGE